MSPVFDVVIVGSGLVGSSLACALDGLPLSVLQIEAEAPRAFDQPLWDERNFALARRSLQLLEGLGVSKAFAAAATPIAEVQVSSRGDFGVVRIRARDYGFDALGATVPASVVAQALAQRVDACRGVQRWTPARVVQLQPSDELMHIEAEVGGERRRIGARLLVGADGTASFVRQALAIGAAHHDYRQTAIVANIEVERDCAATAHERFSADGPMAVLPLGGRRCGVIFSVAADRAAAIAALDDKSLLDMMHDRFGSRLGRFLRLGRRQAWPLKQTLAERTVASRCVLIGNAAQTVHPLGAQGFNLGLRDVAQLSQCLREAAANASDVGSGQLLAGYANARATDRAATTRFAADLLRWFTPQSTVLRHARGLGLAVLERTPPLKRELAFGLMGYRDSRPAA